MHADSKCSFLSCVNKQEVIQEGSISNSIQWCHDFDDARHMYAWLSKKINHHTLPFVSSTNSSASLTVPVGYYNGLLYGLETSRNHRLPRETGRGRMVTLGLFPTIDLKLDPSLKVAAPILSKRLLLEEGHWLGWIIHGGTVPLASRVAIHHNVDSYVVATHRYLQ